MSNILYVNLIEFKEANNKHAETCYAIVASDNYDTSFNELLDEQFESLKSPIDVLEYILNNNCEKWQESFEVIINEDGGKELVAQQGIIVNMNGDEFCFSPNQILAAHAIGDCDDV